MTRAPPPCLRALGSRMRLRAMRTPTDRVTATWSMHRRSRTAFLEPALSSVWSAGRLRTHAVERSTVEFVDQGGIAGAPVRICVVPPSALPKRVHSWEPPAASCRILAAQCSLVARAQRPRHVVEESFRINAAAPRPLARAWRPPAEPNLTVASASSNAVAVRRPERAVGAPTRRRAGARRPRATRLRRSAEAHRMAAAGRFHAEPVSTALASRTSVSARRCARTKCVEMATDAAGLARRARGVEA